MTLYQKPRDEIFASSAPPSEIQPFNAWLRGLGIAFEETNGFPEMTGLNGLFNALNLYIKYLEQNGFAEWSSTLEYPAGAGVRVGLVWYRAKTQNTNKPPATSQSDWELFLNASALSYQEPLYIENNVIKIRDASNAVKGVTQFASAQEIAAKANVSKAINPSNVGQTFAQLFSTNGYCTMPNGIIIQWGTVADDGLTKDFPIPFPNAAVTLVGSAKFDGWDSGSAMNAFIVSRSQFRLRNGGAASPSTPNYYIAIGY